MPRLLAAALAYARQGWPVFPVRGKVPATPHGFQDATTDPATVAAWWRAMPAAGIGVPTGAASGRVILDIDDHAGGVDGFETLRDLEAVHGTLPDTLTAVTGGGGEHRHFRYVPGLHCGELAPGLDLKTDGGYVVLPPSPHLSGRPYAWDHGYHILAPLPPWLAALARPPTPVRAQAVSGDYAGVGQRALDFITHGAPVGRQRLTALAATRNLLSAGFGVDAAAALVWRGLERSPIGDPRRPWRYEDALGIVGDLAAHPLATRMSHV